MQAQLYPFTKNRYFKKKRMRAVDFERDQAFADRKLAFLNHWVFGTGIVFGLGVQRVDSDSLLVEPGLAIDAQGRYLIVDEPAICRVRSLKGFDGLAGERAILWLSYREELLDPMFVTDDEGQSTQYAVAKERYALSLTEEAFLPSPAAERALLSEQVLFEDEELRVVQSIPRVLSAERAFQLRLRFQCFSLEPLELELHYAPGIPGFCGEDGGPFLCERHIRVEKGESELALTVRPVQPAQVARITLDPAGFWLEKRGVRCGEQSAFCEEFAVEPGNVSAALAARLAALSPQELWDDQPGGVPIAGVRFIRYEEKSLLDDVIPLAARRLSAPDLRESLERVAGLFQKQEAPARIRDQAPAPARSAASAAPPPPARQIATGTVSLNAGTNRKAGSVLTSDELPHGLGPGSVYVEFGIEHVYPLANSAQNGTELLLGDASLFDQSRGIYDQAFDRGVRVHPDKGTFELAVRPLADLRQSEIRLRWFAWRAGGDLRRSEPAGRLSRLTPDVIRVAPGATIAFTPVFTGGRVCPCDFFVEGKRNGVITRDGVYTAPNREGLCQVYAQTRGKPEERANAFILVAREEEGNGEKDL